MKTNKRLIPKEGGWYWLKLPGKDWEPLKVEAATPSGWPPTINIGAHAVEVENVQGEWGGKLSPPK